jgi:hypothetical protein
VTARSGDLRLAAGAALAVLVAAAFAAGLAVEPLLDSYLVAAVFWLNLALGGLGVALMHSLTGGRWGAWSRPASGLLMRALVPLALAMLPLAVVYGRQLPDDGALLGAAQRAWFAPAWFDVRLALYFAVWIGLAIALRRPSAQRARVGALGAVLYTLTASLFCIDWLASSRPDATGTIVGFVLVGGQLTGAFAFALVIAALRERAPSRAADRRQDLANLLLAAVVFYGYTLVMQLLIIWSPNLPREIEWYLARGDSVGVAAMIGLVACHTLAIVLLCSRRVKRQREALLAVGGLVLAGHLFDTYWWLAPLLRASPARLLDIALIALLGLAFWAAARRPATTRKPAEALR